MLAMLPAAGAVSKGSEQGRMVIAISPYLCAACAIIIVVVGCCGVYPSSSQLAILVPSGIVLSRLLVAHYKDKSKLLGQFALSVGIIGPLLGQPSALNHNPFSVRALFLFSDLACMWGIVFLILTLFRSLLLRFLETAD